MTTLIDELRTQMGKDRVRTNEPMDRHTAIRIGGPAELFLEVEQVEDLIKIAKIAKRYGQNVTVIGTGSHTLFPTNLTKGVVIKNNCRNFEMMSMKGQIKHGRITFDNALLYADSGTTMNQIVRYTLDQSFSGLEHALGLPGTVGGAIMTDAKNPKTGERILDALTKATILDSEGVIKEVDSAYFTREQLPGIILQAVFRIHAGDKKILWEKADEAVSFRAEYLPQKTAIGPVFKDISLADAMRLPTPGYSRTAGYLLQKVDPFSESDLFMLWEKDPNYLIIRGEVTPEEVHKAIHDLQQAVSRAFAIQLKVSITLIN